MPMADRLTHIDKDGNAVMVDVSGKAETERVATAAGRVLMKPETARLPVFTMAAAGGVLLIQSRPDGATISINGRPQTQKTPAQINLPPGRYQVLLEKGDLRGAQTVDLKDGDLRHISIALSP